MSLVSSIRSEDSKEVFLAIQVDGVTRARTAPLALRGPALSLNHAFHLELERAQLLRVVLLTPGKHHPLGWWRLVLGKKVFFHCLSTSEAPAFFIWLNIQL